MSAKTVTQIFDTHMIRKSIRITDRNYRQGGEFYRC